MEEQLAVDTPDTFISCQEHKTAQCYGDVVKYITPGLKLALIAYCDLGRPDGFEYFFVPANTKTSKGENDGAETSVSAVHCLRMFNRIFLEPLGVDVSPTTNQIRKVFHDMLIQLTSGEDKAREIMELLDKHAGKTIKKHYQFFTEEKACALAKELVKCIIGKRTGRWPEDSQQSSLATKVLEFQAVLDEDEDPEHGMKYDPDEEAGAGWEFGHLFGCFGTATPLAAAPCGAAVPIEDSSASSTPPATPDPQEPANLTPEVDGARFAKTEKKAQLGPETKPRWERPQYQCDSVNTRTPVLITAKRDMKTMLDAWRERHPHSRTAKTNEHRPDDREFYLMARCDLIDENLLMKSHGEFVVRTCMQNFCRAEKAAADAGK